MEHLTVNFHSMPRVKAMYFAQLWRELDRHGKGYLDENELNSFFDKLEKKMHKVIWRKYDTNRSGFIDFDELKAFISDYIAEYGVNLSLHKLKTYTEAIIELFDKDNDHRLSLQEMTHFLDVKKNYLQNFKIQKGSLSVRRKNFDKIFTHYDQNESGTLVDEELDAFIKDIMEVVKGSVTVAELDEQKMKLIKQFNAQHDGRLQKSELALLAMGLHL